MKSSDDLPDFEMALRAVAAHIGNPDEDAWPQ